VGKKKISGGQMNIVGKSSNRENWPTFGKIYRTKGCRVGPKTTSVQRSGTMGKKRARQKNKQGEKRPAEKCATSPTEGRGGSPWGRQGGKRRKKEVEKRGLKSGRGKQKNKGRNGAPCENQGSFSRRERHQALTDGSSEGSTGSKGRKKARNSFGEGR